MCHWSTHFWWGVFWTFLPTTFLENNAVVKIGHAWSFHLWIYWSTQHSNFCSCPLDLIGRITLICFTIMLSWSSIKQLKTLIWKSAVSHWSRHVNKYIRQKCIAHHLLAGGKVVSAHYATISHIRHKYVHTPLELSTGGYGVPIVKICEVNGGNACMTCQV